MTVEIGIDGDVIHIPKITQRFCLNMIIDELKRRAEDVIIREPNSSSKIVIGKCGCIYLHNVQPGIALVANGISSGMSIATRGLFGLVGQAWKLEFAHEYLRYGVVVISAGQLYMISELALIFSLIPVIIILFVIFIIGARKFWLVHYPEKNHILNCFTIYITLHYWSSLILILIV